MLLHIRVKLTSIFIFFFLGDNSGSNANNRVVTRFNGSSTLHKSREPSVGKHVKGISTMDGEVPVPHIRSPSMKRASYPLGKAPAMVTTLNGTTIDTRTHSPQIKVSYCCTDEATALTLYKSGLSM